MKELDDFVEKFDKEGPGTVGEDMDGGLVLMEASIFRYITSRLYSSKEVGRTQNINLPFEATSGQKMSGISDKSLAHRL